MKYFQHKVIITLVSEMFGFYFSIFQLIVKLTCKQTLWSHQQSWISISLKMIRYEFFYSPFTLSLSIFSHTFPSFSSRSVVERVGEDEEPGNKGIQSFSKFSLLLYTEMITTFIPVQTANYSHVKVKQFQFFTITTVIIVENNYQVFLSNANSLPSLAKVENETMPN